MAATRQMIQGWFDRGIEKQATHLIVVCDTYDYEDFPVYVMPDQDVRVVADRYTGANMVRVMEVYNLSLDRDAQLSEHRAFNY